METRESITAADSLADTVFSELFHEARTTSRDRYTSVSVPVRTNEDGAVTEVGTVHHVPRGATHHVRNTSWDGTVTLPVQPFMETHVAKQEIARKLRPFEQKAARP